MERVRGIGGIFFKCADPDVVRAWYRDHLGIPVESWGGVSFVWDADALPGKTPGSTVWSPFAADTKYFAPSTHDYMVNFRVADLDAMLAQLRELGDTVDDKIEESEFGRFGWVMDPEGRRVELWEPPAGA